MSVGRAKRKLIDSSQPTVKPEANPVCPLCDRPIPRAQQDAHHLVPKSRGGRQTHLLHRICHRQIHALLTETELAREYYTPEALRAHPGMQSFIQWVRSKPNDFYQRTSKSARLKSRR
ncbi:MAG: HNH endonuclease [Burkholderiaceae bacterium]